MLKRIILIFAFLLFCALPVCADTDATLGVSTVDDLLGISTVDGFLGQSVASGGDACSSCTSAFVTNTAATDSDWDITDSATYYYTGHHFITGDDSTLCKATFYLTKAGTDISTKTFNAYLFSVDGSGNLNDNGTPDYIAISDNVTGSNDWSDTAVDFCFSSTGTLSTGTSYAVVVNMAGGVDASNYAEMERSTSGQIGGLMGHWSSDLSRDSSTAHDVKIILYEEAP